MVFATQLLDKGYDPDIRTRRCLRLRNQVPRATVQTPRVRETAAFGETFLASLGKGFAAARQVVRPMGAVQVSMLLLVVGYYFLKPEYEGFRRLVEIKESLGRPFAFLSMGLISVFAEILRRSGLDQKTDEPFWNAAAFGFLVFGFMGIVTDSFYNVQNAMWGWLPPAEQVVAKVLTDQFIYTVIFANPYQTLLYVFKDCRFSPRAFLGRTSPFGPFYAREMLPVLVTNWAFWIPTTVILYCLPTDLQFVICQLAIVIWVLLLTTITNKA